MVRPHIAHQVKQLNAIEIILPKQNIRSSSKQSEGHVVCDRGYDYWIIMENPAAFFPRAISVLYKFELG